MQKELLSNGTVVFTHPLYAFGEDALLLASFAHSFAKKRLLDLGCGCGIVALSLYDSGYRGTITALDHQPQATELVTAAAQCGSIADFSVVTGDLRQFSQSVKFDCVVCNPPYFSAKRGAVSPIAARGIARTEISCTIEDVCAAAARNLQQRGHFVLCYKPDRLATLFSALRAARLEPKALAFVRHSSNDLPWLALVAAALDGGEGLQILPDIRNRDAPSACAGPFSPLDNLSPA